MPAIVWMCGRICLWTVYKVLYLCFICINCVMPICDCLRYCVGWIPRCLCCIRNREVYLTPFLTEESTIRLLCQPLQLALKENDINVNVKFNDGNHPVGHEWLAYCCSDREGADKNKLQEYSSTDSHFVLFFRKDKTEMDMDKCLFVTYLGNDVKLMEHKKGSNDTFLKSFKDDYRAISEPDVAPSQRLLRRGNTRHYVMLDL